MGYLIAAGLVVALLYTAAGRRVARRYAHWRSASAIAAVGLFAAGGFEAMRGGLVVAIILALLGIGMTASARWPRQAIAMEPQGGMSRDQARSILGVGEAAGPAEIRAAYARLIQRVHPDKGGAPGLAAQLNLARDVLLKG
ncbi:molecular chaperone DnaJ [Phenylobacterium montanum]|uniref:Molecular chaperone DnaJ n=1 Tax=Phenylobacterium montanum TaxID=2823693 RepID=A0A975IWJ8_9CAUL|nr:molecular chaperone DnaJ [Caulobacter sp. S6]QUD88456.1 molecular chaperone DnaJ [Caulobacter sp. S6]